MVGQKLEGRFGNLVSNEWHRKAERRPQQTKMRMEMNAVSGGMSRVIKLFVDAHAKWEWCPRTPSPARGLITTVSEASTVYLLYLCGFIYSLLPIESLIWHTINHGLCHRIALPISSATLSHAMWLGRRGGGAAEDKGMHKAWLWHAQRIKPPAKMKMRHSYFSTVACLRRTICRCKTIVGIAVAVAVAVIDCSALCLCACSALLFPQVRKIQTL